MPKETDKKQVAETQKWYRMEIMDHNTAHLYSLEVTGRKVGRKRLIMESTPFIVFANWRALTEQMIWES